ncbi:MAG: autotransporter outer membrane beta-barrel domain-containing protein [Minisyncoccota bacterium]
MRYTPFSPTAARGYVLLLAIVFLGIFVTIAVAYLSFVTASARAARYDVASAQALTIAEAGIDEAIYQLNANDDYTGETNTALGGGVFTVVVSNVNTSTKRLTVTSSVPATNPVATQSVTALTDINSSLVSFHYGVQVGAGGVTMNNGSEIIGNLFSDGNVSGSGTITGDATVASGTPSTSLSGVTVNGTAWAHTLSSCTVGGDAFYQNISGCTVSGTEHPGSADAQAADLPISNAQISSWEATATAGGVTAGSYTVSGSKTFGPQEIDGNLTVSNGATLTLSGVVWVKGNIIFSNNSTLTVSSATGNEGAILIADVPGSESTEGTVTLSNNIIISGNGSPGSYPMILSTNSGSAAISLSNNSNSVILYASRGTVLVSNNGGANEITAYQLSLSNNTTVTYLSGLQSSSFSNGPGGSWAIIPHTYAIAH